MELREEETDIRTVSFLSLSGRINRRTFIVRLVTLFIVFSIGLPILKSIIFGSSSSLYTDGNEWMMIIFVILSYPTIAQRMHDFGWQGWIGIISWTPALILTLPFQVFMPGNREVNKYGAVPTGWWKAVSNENEPEVDQFE